MKKLHIVGLIIIALALGGILYTTGNVTTYEGFESARMNEGKTYKVVGKLSETKEMEYNPKQDPNFFTFYLVDNDGVEEKVIYNDPKPQDFERSEQVVVTGSYKNGEFYASDILMKCPSKYIDDEMQLVETNS